MSEIRAQEVSRRTARHGPQVISTGPQSQPLLHVSIGIVDLGPLFSPMVLSFSCSEPGHVCIEADPFVSGMGIFDLSTFQQCRTEVNLQCVVFAIFEVLRNVYPVRDEHIVAFQDSLPIDLDGRKRVKAIENKLMNLAVIRGSDFWEFRSVCPTLVRDPFTFEFVETKKGVRDAVVQCQC
jgi:hypothetical protein